jgi:hypothetical protein
MYAFSEYSELESIFTKHAYSHPVTKILIHTGPLDDLDEVTRKIKAALNRDHYDIIFGPLEDVPLLLNKYKRLAAQEIMAFRLRIGK